MSTPADYCLLALTIWREARGEGLNGMKAVACVVRNRAKRRNSSYYIECVRPWQFSSLTDPKDPQLANWPKPEDSTWQTAQILAGSVIDGHTDDITGGATMYYADSIPFPASWDKSKLRETVKLGNHTFFQEI